MKKNLISVLIALVLTAVLCLALVACGGETPCAHSDADTDGKCDSCGADVSTLPSACTSHTDLDKNGKCDNCDADVEVVSDGTLTLIKDGVPTFQVVMGTLSTANRSTVLGFVNKVNQRIGETKVSAVNESATNEQPIEILVGSISTRGDKYAIDKYSLGYDGYIVEVIGTKLVVLSSTDSGLAEALSDLEKKVFGIKGTKVNPIDNLTVTENIDERITTFAVNSVTIVGSDITNYVIAADKKDSYAYSTAQTVRTTIYQGTGKYLELVDASTISDDALAIVIQTIENGGDKSTPEGYQAYVTDGGRVVIECEFPDKLATLANDTIKNKIAFASKKNVTLKAGSLDTRNIRTISYGDFNAKGDGQTDDSEAIRATHEYANLWGHNVKADAGKSYYIGVLESPIIIKTNTDWNGSTIIIDDSVIDWNDGYHRGIWVFEFVSDDEANGASLTVPEGLTLTKGQQNIGMTFDKPCMIKISNSNKKIYIRYGANENDGVTQSEIILVDENGNVDPSTPIQYDYSEITGIVRYSIDDAPISVGNATVKTIAPNPKEQDPDYDNNYCYYKRGIMVRRSNTTLYKINYVVDNEDMTIETDRNGDGVIDIYHADKSYGVPYSGSISFATCYNATLKDSTIEGHQAYSFWQGANRDTRNEMGSYAINGENCVNITFKSVKQYENQTTGETITNRVMYHGIMGSNFCRNFVVDDCRLDRFDSHQGLSNATLTNSTFGFGILVIGGGTLYIENVERISGSQFILLREDYNSIFAGDVILKNCVSGESIKCILSGNWLTGYNGLPNYITTSVTIDGLVAKSNEMSVFKISNATVATLTDANNPLYIPTSVTVSNAYRADGKTKLNVKISAYADAFTKVPFEQK